MARISTHVLDTAHGRPARGVQVDLYHCPEAGSDRLLKSMSTDEDGRTAEPLAEASELTPGIYKLVFHVGRYFQALDIPLPTPPFLDEIAIRFGVADPLGIYHVPLLLSPYGYSTYRGS